MASDQKSAFTEAEQAEIKVVFDSFDTDKSGRIDATELQSALKNLKVYKSPEQVQALIKEVDKDMNGTVEFNELLDIVYNIKNGKESAFTKIYTKQKDLIKIQTATGGQHSFAEEEMAAFANHISQCLSGDADCKYLLPVNPVGLDLCKKVDDGVLLAKFINIAVPETIDERALNKPKPGAKLSVFPDK